MATSAQLREEIRQGRWDAALAALMGQTRRCWRGSGSGMRRAGAVRAVLRPGAAGAGVLGTGRAELGGNHTDHQHGYGLAAAVTLDLVAVAAPSDDGYVRVKSRGFNKLDVIDLATAEPQEGRAPIRPA